MEGAYLSREILIPFEGLCGGTWSVSVVRRLCQPIDHEFDVRDSIALMSKDVSSVGNRDIIPTGTNDEVVQRLFEFPFIGRSSTIHNQATAPTGIVPRHGSPCVYSRETESPASGRDEFSLERYQGVSDLTVGGQ